jgi:hypothetical protein
VIGSFSRKTQVMELHSCLQCIHKNETRRYAFQNLHLRIFLHNICPSLAGQIDVDLPSYELGHIYDLKSVSHIYTELSHHDALLLTVQNLANNSKISLVLRAINWFIFRINPRKIE